MVHSLTQDQMQGGVCGSEVCSEKESQNLVSSSCTVFKFKAKVGRETAAGNVDVSALLTWKWL